MRAFSTNITFWLIFSTAGASGAISIFTGSVTSSAASAAIAGDIVAEKNIDWRRTGSLEMIRLMSGRNPMSSIRSASSRTNISTWSRNTIPWVIRSMSRPGQAITVSAPFFRSFTWPNWLTPPIRQA